MPTIGQAEYSKGGRMNGLETSDLRYLFDHLVKGFSTHNQMASRAWVALAVVSLVGMAQASGRPDVDVAIPLIGASVSRVWFCTMTAALCAVLTVKWLEPVAQCTRARWAVDHVLKELRKTDPVCKVIDPQDVWDFTRRPGTLTVASLPLAWLGRAGLVTTAKDVAPSDYARSQNDFRALKFAARLVHYSFPFFGVGVLSCFWIPAAHLSPQWSGWTLFQAVILALSCAIVVWQLCRAWRMDSLYTKGALDRFKAGAGTEEPANGEQEGQDP
jgi:hypothetical protein